MEVGNGAGHTAGEAMAMAWLCAMAPDALVDSYVEEGSAPFEVPDDWRFKLTARDEVDNGVAVDGRPYLPFPPGEFYRVVEEAIKRNRDAEAIAAAILQEYRIPLALQRQLIRHGLAAVMTRLLVADRGGETLMKPTPDDIRRWIATRDPPTEEIEPFCWYAKLFAPSAGWHELAGQRYS